MLAGVAQAAPVNSWSSDSDFELHARDTFDNDVSLSIRGFATADDMLYLLARDVDGVQDWLEARGNLGSKGASPEKKEAKKVEKDRKDAKKALEGKKKAGASDVGDFKSFAQGPAGQFVNKPKNGKQASLQTHGLL